MADAEEVSARERAARRHEEGMAKVRKKCAARASAAAAAAAAGAWADRDLLPAEQLIGAARAGGELLVLRSSLRTAALFAEELRAAARLAALPEESLVPLGSGLWLLQESEDDRPRSDLLSRLPGLCGVRLRLELCCCAPDASSLIKELDTLRLKRDNTRGWTLRYEQQFPAADLTLAPWTGISTAAAVSIGLAGALGSGYVAWSEALGRINELDEFVVLESKRALFLCRNRPIKRHRLPCAEERKAKVLRTAPESAEIGSSREAWVPLRAELAYDEAALPWWTRRWECRPFAFSASLDPLIASAAVSITASIHHRHESGTGAARAPLRLLDPCCGSGTVLVAGLAQGHDCIGSDIRGEFVGRTRENLEYMEFSPDRVFEHDARTEFSATVGARPDIVVSNPPWGKNLGLEQDGAEIIASVVNQFAGATMCWLANVTAFAAVTSLPGVELVYHCHVGGVEAFVIRTIRG